MPVSCVLSRSVISNSATPWTIACQTPLFLRFSRQEYWDRLPFPSPGDPPDPGIKSLSPTLAGGFFTTESLGKPNSGIPCWKPHHWSQERWGKKKKTNNLPIYTHIQIHKHKPQKETRHHHTIPIESQTGIPSLASNLFQFGQKDFMEFKWKKKKTKTNLLLST